MSKGLVCGLNNEKPKFSVTCLDYDFDKNGLKTLLDQKRKYYRKQNVKIPTLYRNISNSTVKYTETEKSERFGKLTISSLPETFEIRNSSSYFFYLFKDKKIVLLLDKNGIFIYKYGYIHWRTILMVSIKEKPNLRYPQRILVIARTNFQDDFEIRVDHLDINMEMLSHVVEVFKEAYSPHLSS